MAGLVSIYDTTCTAELAQALSDGTIHAPLSHLPPRIVDVSVSEPDVQPLQFESQAHGCRARTGSCGGEVGEPFERIVRKPRSGAVETM